MPKLTRSGAAPNLVIYLGSVLQRILGIRKGDRLEPRLDGLPTNPSSVTFDIVRDSPDRQPEAEAKHE